MFDLTEGGARQTVRTIKDADGKAQGYTVDITDCKALDAAVAYCEAGEAIDVPVNNAGWQESRSFLETDIDLWKIIDIDLWPAAHASRDSAWHGEERIWTRCQRQLGCWPRRLFGERPSTAPARAVSSRPQARSA